MPGWIFERLKGRLIYPEADPARFLPSKGDFTSLYFRLFTVFWTYNWDVANVVHINTIISSQGLCEFWNTDTEVNPRNHLTCFWMLVDCQENGNHHYGLFPRFGICNSEWYANLMYQRFGPKLANNLHSICVFPAETLESSNGTSSSRWLCSLSSGWNSAALYNGPNI